MSTPGRRHQPISRSRRFSRVSRCNRRRSFPSEAPARSVFSAIRLPPTTFLRQVRSRGLSGGPVPVGARRGVRGFQQLWLAPRQRSGDDARHVRERADQESHARWGRGGGTLYFDRAAGDRATGEKMPIYDAAMRTRRMVSLWSSSPARNMAPVRRAIGRPKAPVCSGLKPWWPRASNASTAPISLVWGCCRCSSGRARTPRR